MEAEKTRKIRGKNFVEEEKHNLVDLVMEYQEIIENKATDGVTIAEKNRVWKKVTTIFNSSFALTGERTPQQLKQMYESIKYKTKKQMSNNKVELYKTGGGSAASLPLSGLQEKIAAIGGLQFSPAKNLYDSNAGFLEELYDIQEYPMISDIVNTLSSNVVQIPAHELAKEAISEKETADVPLLDGELRTNETRAPDKRNIKKSFIRKVKANKRREVKVQRVSNKELTALKKIKLQKQIKLLDAELELKRIELQIRREELKKVKA